MLSQYFSVIMVIFLPTNKFDFFQLFYTDKYYIGPLQFIFFVFKLLTKPAPMCAQISLGLALTFEGETSVLG